MINNITIGQYIPTGSVIHSLDPRSKILLSIFYILSLFLIDEIAGFIPAFLLVLLVILLARLPIRYLIRGLRPLLFIIVFTFLLNIFMIDGRELFRIGPLAVSYEGLLRAVFLMVRLILLILASSILTLTTSPMELTDGLELLLKPFTRIGLPAHEFAMMMTIALRFIPTLLEETEKIMRAQMARGADFQSGNIIRRARGFIPLLVPLFISAFRRADELAMAMEARCYRGGRGRTRMKQLKATSKDGAAALIMIIFVVGVVILF